MLGQRLNARLDQVKEVVSSLQQGAHEEFVKQTPIRTGNARSKTDLQGNEIQANYPYATRLEKEGWSRQAPEGMSKPTIVWIRDQLKGL